MERLLKRRPPGDDEVIRELIEEMRDQMPADIKAFEVSLGEDHTGDPAAFIVFRVARPDAIDMSRVKRLAAYRAALERKIDDMRLDHFAYTSFQGLKSKSNAARKRSA